MIRYHLSSGSGGMADALDSGSSGSLSCESSSLFFRTDPVTYVVTGFLFFPRKTAALAPRTAAPDSKYLYRGSRFKISIVFPPQSDIIIYMEA